MGVVTQIHIHKHLLQEAGEKSIDFIPKYVVVLHVMMQRIDRLGLLKRAAVQNISENFYSKVSRGLNIIFFT